MYSSDFLSHQYSQNPCVLNQLVDNHGRKITYLRLAITDRCNLRCHYCMPEGGVTLIPHADTLSYEEMERLVVLFQDFGVTKVRITGGEPFARVGCFEFLQNLKNKVGVDQLHITTNGVETAKYLIRLKQAGISGINLSLDTMDRKRFKEITRRDRLDRVLATMYGALELNIPLKINSVVTAETSDRDIIALADLAKLHPINLRFIELMPFSGRSKVATSCNHTLIHRLECLFPDLQERRADTVSTARQFGRPGFLGSIGIIEGSSRTFCATCNKLRITPQGMMKACLYDDGVLDLRKLLRSGVSDNKIALKICQCLNHRYADGHETEMANVQQNEPSMATIGG